jgi:sulfur-carrier protein adenylyltransferase/sulfurtransferase
MFEKVKQLFTPTDSMDAEQARVFINENKEGSFTLLDVRQPREYESGHIPGAKPIPLTQISDAYNQLDPDKPVIVY